MGHRRRVAGRTGAGRTLSPDRLAALVAAAHADVHAAAMHAARRHDRNLEARAYGRWLAEETLTWAQISTAYMAIHDTDLEPHGERWRKVLPWLAAHVPRRYTDPDDGEAIRELLAGIMDVWHEVREAMTKGEGVASLRAGQSE